MHKNRYFLETRSTEMKKALTLARAVAKSSARVMLLGESGVGKEVFAKLIHEESTAAAEPFVPLNCAAIPKDLLESELFGHVRGAFTNAISHKIGLMEEVGAGTLFLDEVGEIPFALQAKLLRVLQDGDFRRVGATRQQCFVGRVISATNADIGHKVRAGGFREDLMYRLSVIPITIPPLRERRADIPALLNFFLADMGINAKIDKDAFKLLADYAFPGNIRQLKNLLEYVHALSLQKGVIDLELVQQALKAQMLIAGPVAFKKKDSSFTVLTERLDLIEQGFQEGLKIEEIGRKVFPDLPPQSARVRVSQWLKTKKVRSLIGHATDATKRWAKIVIWFDYYDIEL